MEHLRCVVERITYQNDLNGYSVIKCRVKETKNNRSPEYISSRYGYDYALTEQIVRLHLTHPGVDSDGIMKRMGY